MKYNVIALTLILAILPVLAEAQYPAGIPVPQPAFGLAQNPGPDMTLTEQYPAPAPTPSASTGTIAPLTTQNGGEWWNAFSPPEAPVPPLAGANYAPAFPTESPVGGVSPGSTIPPLYLPPAAGTTSAPLAGQPLPGATGIPGAAGYAPNGINYQAFQQVAPYQPGQQGNPFGPDPFLQPGQAIPGQLFQSTPGAFSQFGANGPEPYRFGWQQRLDAHWITSEDVNNTPLMGEFGVFGLNYRPVWTQQMPGWIFTGTPKFGFRQWDTGTELGLPDNVYTFGWGFQMETPRNAGPVGYMLGFHPSFNSDLDGSSSIDAWNFDGRGALFFQLSPYWQAIIGFEYWDRVRDRFLPAGGLVYTDDFWEWRFTFPEARVNLFLGNEYMWSKWLYGRVEYHVEAYEIDHRVGMGTEREQIEISDWRALIGLKMDTGYYDWYIEGGWVFDREVDFARSAGFDVHSGFIGQIGVRF